MVECGLDLVDVDRVVHLIRRHGDRFLSRVFTEREIAYCHGRPERLAARLAAKEAAVKALGTGFRGVGWKDIEVVVAAGGRPTVELHGRARALAAAAGPGQFSVSLTHTGAMAGAVIVWSHEPARR